MQKDSRTKVSFLRTSIGRYSSTAQYIANSLFPENTWNLPTTDPVEMLSWESLSKNQLAGAQSIGFVVEAEEVWDCFQNHYEDYDWKELVKYDLSYDYMVLGWTEGSWYEVDPPPASENATWANLTAVEREAAGNLCFFEYIWDEVNLMNWTDLETTTTALSMNLTDLESTTTALPLVYVTPIPLEPTLVTTVAAPSEPPHSNPPEPV